MNVLSLFDGMSCGMMALQRAGIKVDNYYSSEIDKYAMTVSAANYPEIIQVGDITKLDLSTLPKIDLVMGGSPCQGFSVAGKGLAFDDPRSALFFEFVKCVKELNPKYFLLENVNMKKEWLGVITDYMGVEGIKINSALVSAQNRNRWYWSNIPGIAQPKDRGIVLRDILETNPDNNLDKMTTKEGKAYCLTASYQAAVPHNSLARSQRSMIPVLQDDLKSLPLKSQTIKAQYAKSSKANFERSGTYHATGIQQKHTHDTPKIIKSRAFRARSLNNDGKNVTWKETKPKQMLELRKDNKSNTISSATKDSVVVKTKPNQINPSKKANVVQPYMQDRVFYVDGKSHALTREFAARTNVGEEQEVYWRKLTPVECERLQTVPDNYTNHVSNTQRYKMLGNGWNVETVVGILKKIKDDI